MVATVGRGAMPQLTRRGWYNFVDGKLHDIHHYGAVGQVPKLSPRQPDVGLSHISHINLAGLAAISNGTTQWSRIAEHSGYHEC